jgi:hypothetical protein
MGRTSSGKSTVEQSNRLDLRTLLKDGYIQKGKQINGVLSWSNGNSIKFESMYSDYEIYFRLIYTNTNHITGEDTDCDYKIELERLPSNLGKGEVLYFVCPESYKRARILFMAYGHHKYIHRDWYFERYGLRLYYNSQLIGKKLYHNTKYFDTLREIEDYEEIFYVKFRKLFYKGKPTKAYKRLLDLDDKRDYYDRMRSQYLIQSFVKFRLK